MHKVLKQSAVLLAIILFVVALQAEAQCPKNQQFTDCGSACPPKCNDNPLKLCTMQCIVGCQCKTGYLLNDRNECVTPEEC